MFSRWGAWEVSLGLCQKEITGTSGEVEFSKNRG